MLNIIICDDEQKMVDHIKDIITKFICFEDITDMQIELATTDPSEVLALFVKVEKFADGKKNIIKQPLKERILFLDINFASEVPHHNGIELGRAIRRYDISSFIVFITNQIEESRDVIQRKVTPLGFIAKNFSEKMFSEAIAGDLIEARKRTRMSTLNKKIIEVKNNKGLEYFKLDEICYIVGNENGKFESLPADQLDMAEPIPKGLSMLFRPEDTEARGRPLTRRLKYYTEKIPELLQLGRSYLINPDHKERVIPRGKNVLVVMANGEEISVDKESYDKYAKLFKEYKKNF